jgi:hypothetical protein
VSASRRYWTVRDLLDLRETALGGYVATCLGSQYETGEKTEILLSGSLSALQIFGMVPPP